MATPAAIQKKLQRQLLAMDKKMDDNARMLSDIISLLDVGENPPDQVKPKAKRKPRTPKATSK